LVKIKDFIKIKEADDLLLYLCSEFKTYTFFMKKYYLLFVVATGLFLSCKKNNDWSISIPDITSSSSPRAVDLNEDGILDIVMGAGGDEWSHTKMGVVAINGANGAILWTAEASNQMVGTPVFLDINDDKIPDVIIGGRSAELQAIDGKNGKVIWQFYKGENAYSARKEGLYNFYNPQFVKDQDGDGLLDLVICNGGDAAIATGALHRPPGKLMLLSSKTGNVIAEAKMPDLHETYISPVCFDCENSDNPTFVFGTGGESKSGHLYLCKLSDLKKGDLKNAIVLDSTTEKGYEAPPVLADFNNDKQLDILFNTVEGKTILLDGLTHKTIWSVKCDSAEVFSQPAVGYFTGNDRNLDVFVSFSIGVYPYYQRTEQWLIDGKTGKVISKFKDQRFTYASPLTADLDEDGTDDVVINMVRDSAVDGRNKPYYELSIFDFKHNKNGTLASRQNGACFASTPYLGDLDNDGKLDVIYSGSPALYSIFPGTSSFQRTPVMLFIHRVEMDKINAKAVKWGSYMGKDAKSIWR
jgi:outer membrane protein assembly factor BamB